VARCLSVYTPLSAEADDMVEAELMVDLLLSFSLYAIVCRMFVVSTDGNWAFTARLYKHKTHHHRTCSYEAFTQKININTHNAWFKCSKYKLKANRVQVRLPT